MVDTLYSTPHVPQVVFYQSGVGTWGDKVIEQLDGGAFGSRVHEDLNLFMIIAGIVGASLGTLVQCCPLVDLLLMLLNSR